MKNITYVEDLIGKNVVITTTITSGSTSESTYSGILTSIPRSSYGAFYCIDEKVFINPAFVISIVVK